VVWCQAFIFLATHFASRPDLYWTKQLFVRLYRAVLEVALRFCSVDYDQVAHML
jgi:hypothetical protein